MKKIVDKKILKEYIKKYNMDEIFSKDMAPYMTLYMYDKNEYICREGENLNSIFFVVSGRAKVYKNLSNGKSMLACFYDGFKIIGDVEFTRCNVADCSVQAITELYAIGISFDIVHKILFNDASFLLYVCSYLGEKLRMSCNNSSINMLYSLEERLAGYICALISDKESEENFFEFEASYIETAELLGTSYRHLRRTLNKLCENNILEKHGKGYVVRNMERLKEFSQDVYKRN